MKETSVKVNFIYQVLYQILSIIMPLITAPYISRVLGADGIGINTYTYSITTYFVLVAKLGIGIYGNRTIALVRDDQDKLNHTFSNLYAIHAIVAFLVLVAYGLYIVLFSTKYRLIFVIQGFYVVAEMLQINWLFFGLERFKITVIRDTIIRLLTLAAIFAFVRTKEDVWKYCAIMAIGMTISESSIWLLAPRYVKLVKPDWKVSLSYLKPLFLFFIPSIAISIYKLMDKIMLGRMSGTVECGFYENSERIIAMSLSVVTALGTVMMPRMTNLVSKGDVTQSRKMIRLSMKFVLLLTLAMAFGISGVSTVFAPVFFGEEFINCNVLMMGLAITMPITAFANVLRTQFLIPNSHDTVFRISVIAGAVVNFIVNLIYIPRMGAMGAVIGTIAAEIAVCLIQTVFCTRELPIWQYILDSIPYMVFGTLMMLLTMLIGSTMGNSVITLIVQILTGALFYSVVCCIFLYFKKDELWNSITGIISGVKSKIGR